MPYLKWTSSFLNGQGFITVKPLFGIDGLGRKTENWVRSQLRSQIHADVDPYTCTGFHWRIITKVWRPHEFFVMKCVTCRHSWTGGVWVEGRRMSASSLTPCGVVCTVPITGQAWGHVTVSSPPLLPSSPSEPGSIATSQGLLKGQWRGASRWEERQLPLPSFFLIYK